MVRKALVTSIDMHIGVRALPKNNSGLPKPHLNVFVLFVQYVSAKPGQFFTGKNPWQISRWGTLRYKNTFLFFFCTCVIVSTSLPIMFHIQKRFYKQQNVYMNIAREFA